MKTKAKMNWIPKYVKLILKKMDSPFYMERKKNMNIWGIVKETKPGSWEVVYRGHEEFDNSSPQPLDVQMSGIPNLQYFDYEELSNEEVFIYKL